MGRPLGRLVRGRFELGNPSVSNFSLRVVGEAPKISAVLWHRLGRIRGPDFGNRFWQRPVLDCDPKLSHKLLIII